MYCAFEDLFEVVAGTFENQIGEEGRYHIELLRQLTVAIEGVRPALLSPECYRFLDNLRAFRHFFRHAYSFELDERKVRLVLDDALKLKDLYRGDLDRFLLALEESAISPGLDTQESETRARGKPEPKDTERM